MQYSAEYFTSNNYGIDPKRALMYAQERARIQELKPMGGAILDIGCGIGDFLDGFGCEWRKYGTDISQYARTEAINRGVFILESIYEVVGSFDVVVFRGTIQHLPDPFEQIAHAALLLKPGGLMVFLATPDADSICYRLFGDLPALDPALNYWIPSQRTLTNVLTNLGMVVTHTLHPYRETAYAQPVQDAWRFVLRLFGRKSKFAFPGNMVEIYAIKP